MNEETFKPWSETPAHENNIDRTESINKIELETNSLEKAIQYYDLFEEYMEASINIKKYGTMVLHPRDMKPMENPYIKRRDKIRQEFKAFRQWNFPWLWEQLK